jgi:hypothetical protein
MIFILNIAFDNFYCIDQAHLIRLTIFVVQFSLTK